MASGVGNGLGMLVNDGLQPSALTRAQIMMQPDGAMTAIHPPPSLPNQYPMQVQFPIVAYPPQLVVPVLLPNGGFRIALLMPKLPSPSDTANLTLRQKKAMRFRERRRRQRLRRDDNPDSHAERSRRAKAQPRNEYGYFISESDALERRVNELRQKIHQSESEAVTLRARLSTAEQELHRIQLIASPEQATAQPEPLDGTVLSPAPAAALELGAAAAPTTPRDTPRLLPPPSPSADSTPSGVLLAVPVSPSPIASASAAAAIASFAVPTPPPGRKRRAVGES